MQSRIRIIKRSEGATTNSLPADQRDMTDHQRERDTANTVKSWVAEWEARNRLAHAAAFRSYVARKREWRVARGCE